MRLSLRGDGPLERLALRLGLVPVPAAEAWGGMAVSAVLIAATRVGLTARLARGGCTAAEASTDLGLDPTATGLLLDCLRSVGHVSYRAGSYRLSRSSRRWLDPRSELSVAQFVAGTFDYWDWWSGLPDVLRTGSAGGHHDAPSDDPYWDRYINGQYELARLSATEVARRLHLPAGPVSVLDVGGGHGWYSAALCLRHPQLRSTVLDLPGSARVGRQIVSRAGLSDRIRYQEGDALNTELGTGYHVALCFNLVHHLTPEQVVTLLTRIHSTLAPGGSVAVMDAFTSRPDRLSAAAATLGMFMYLSSGARCYTVAQLHEWLSAAGFAKPRRIPARRIPGLALYQAGKDQAPSSA